MSSSHQTNLLFFPSHQPFAWLKKLDSDVAEEFRSSAIAAIGDLAASHDMVAVTGRDGFLSAALRWWQEIIRAAYSGKKSSDR
jgi:hypothetical protein